MSRQLTPEERDALSEDDLIAYDIQHVLRGRGVSAATQRSIVRNKIRRERAERAQDAADDALAAEVNSTRTDIRRARAERATAEAARRSSESRRAARAAVGGAVSPSQAGTQAARQAVIARRDRNRTRARELRDDGLSAAQIARRMTAERNERLLPDDPRRPDVAPRTVQRWLAD